MVVVEGVVDPLVESSPHIVAIAILDRLDHEVAQAPFLEDVAEDVEYLAFESLALDGELVEETVIDRALAGFLGDEAPEVADLGLPDAVDAPEPLLHAVGIPRQVVVDHQVCALEIHTLTGGVGGNKHANIFVGAEEGLNTATFVPVSAAADRDDCLRVAEDAGDLVLEIVQRVAVLAEDDDLPLAAVGIVHLWRVLQQFGKLVPLAVLAGGDHGLGL